MALSVVEKKCRFDGKSGVVVVASDLDRGNLAIEELLGAGARNLALKTAQEKGLSAAGVNGSIATYPVDERGEEIRGDQLGVAAVAAYHADIPVTARLV